MIDPSEAVDPVCLRTIYNRLVAVHCWTAADWKQCAWKLNFAVEAVNYIGALKFLVVGRMVMAVVANSVVVSSVRLDWMSVNSMLVDYCSIVEPFFVVHDGHRDSMLHMLHQWGTTLSVINAWFRLRLSLFKRIEPFFTTDFILSINMNVLLHKSIGNSITTKRTQQNWEILVYRFKENVKCVGHDKNLFKILRNIRYIRLLIVRTQQSVAMWMKSRN